MQILSNYEYIFILIIKYNFGKAKHPWVLPITACDVCIKTSKPPSPYKYSGSALGYTILNVLDISPGNIII